MKAAVVLLLATRAMSALAAGTVRTVVFVLADGASKRPTRPLPDARAVNCRL